MNRRYSKSQRRYHLQLILSRKEVDFIRVISGDFVDGLWQLRKKRIHEIRGNHTKRNDSCPQLRLILRVGPVGSHWLPVIFSLFLFAGNNVEATNQGRDPSYSKFIHSSQSHTAIACADCHTRTPDNSATPQFPGHKACTNCHLAQFVTPAVSMCLICHKDVSSGNPPLLPFPTRFNESFNVRFDHAQHLTSNARPQNGCRACHNRPVARGAGLSIPLGLSAHTQCYSCHTPTSRSDAGHDLGSCGVCHEQKSYSRTSTNARSFRYAFHHAKHDRRQRLDCTDCHRVTAGLPQGRQVTSPAPAEHFPAGRMSCLTCHNGKRAFGGDLAFKDCRRCHTETTF